MEQIIKDENKYNHAKSLVALFPVCVAINFILGFLIRDNTFIPLWLEGVGSYIGAVIGGPVYGVVVHLVSVLVHSTSVDKLSYALTMFPAIGSIVGFSFLAKLGYFRRKRDLVKVIIAITVIYTFAAVPIFVATTGGAPTSNILAISLYKGVLGVSAPVPVASIVSIFIAKLLDNFIMIGAVYVLIHSLWNFWDSHFDVKCMEELKIAVVKKKDLKK